MPPKPFTNTKLWMNASSMDDFLPEKEKKTTLRDEAKALKARAKALMAEAKSMEMELMASRSKLQKAKATESDELIESLFPSATDKWQAHDIAKQLKEERYSPDLVYVLVDRIFERQMIAIGQKMSPTTAIITSSEGNQAVNATEAIRLSLALNTLTEAAGILDDQVSNLTDVAIATESRRWKGRVGTGIQARINELYRSQNEMLDRRKAAEINKVASSNYSVEEYIQQTFSEGGAPMAFSEDEQMEGMNVTEEYSSSPMTPMWVPSSFLPFIISSDESTLGQEEVDQIKDNVLQGSCFFLTSSDSIPGAAIFRGNIRTSTGTVSINNSTNYTAVVFEEIQNRLKDKGLDEKVQVFLMPDPEWIPKKDDRESQPKPVLLALSKTVSPDSLKERKTNTVKIRNMLAYGFATLATLAYSVSAYALNPNFFDALMNKGDAKALVACIPVFLGVVSVQLFHEVAHFLVAKRRRIKIARPLPLFSPALGLYGCITKLKSFPSNRAALFDFALSGPLASMLVSLGCIFSGMLLTVNASPLHLAKFPVLPAAILKSSFLIGSITSRVASKTLMLPLSQPIPLHPLFVVGYAGLLASALNLLPIFRLDGGRAASAAIGRRQTAIVSVSALLLLTTQALSRISGLGFLWGLMIVAFQSREEIPVRDEVTEIDTFRFGTWLLSLLLSYAILSPFPGYQVGEMPQLLNERI